MIIDYYEEILEYCFEEPAFEYLLDISILRDYETINKWPLDYYRFVGIIDAMLEIDALLDLTGNLDSSL